MFASQLLRVLEAIPSDAKFETSVEKQAKQDMIVKENQNDSESFWRDQADPVFESKGERRINGPERDKGGDESQSPMDDDFSTNDEFGSDNSLRKEDQHGANEKDTVHGSVEHECLLLTEEHKKVLDFDSPELIVCYKEVDHIVKDIVVDDGTPDSHFKSMECSGDLEVILSYGLKAQLLNNAKEVSDNKLDQENQTSPLQSPSAPLQEYGTHSFLRSFLDATDGEGSIVTQPLDEQCPPGVQLNSLHYDSRVERGSITFNFSTSGSKNLENTKYDLRETSFPGSISLRSDGSATSSRSFAFPILQTEWDSSPVRMVEADRRNFRKHKGCRSGLLCCIDFKRLALTKH